MTDTIIQDAKGMAQQRRSNALDAELEQLIA